MHLFPLSVDTHSPFTLKSTALKVSKYGVFSGPYFPVLRSNTEIYGVKSVFSPSTGKYGPEKTPYLDTFQAVICFNSVHVSCVSFQKHLGIESR